MIASCSFRIAFWLLLGGMMALQVYFAPRPWPARPWPARPWPAVARTTVGCKPIAREGWGTVGFRAVRALSLVTFLVLYAVNSPWLEVLSVPLANWLRWAGIVLGVVSLTLYAWSRAVLGKAWSSQLQLREQHGLVTTGPYARIRHPIYAALLGFLAGIALVTANGYLVAFLAVSTVDLAIRMPKEEQMMIEAFGEAYTAYMRKTGRLLPRLSGLCRDRT